MNPSTNLIKDYPDAITRLKENFSGDIDLREETKILYSTDASIYKELPKGIVFPKTAEDVAKLIAFAHETKIPIIARGGGTSLAGQVVGAGIIADVSLYMNKLLEINADEGWARVQPGLIRDDLNTHAKPHRLFFAPETSSASRATLGGMIGNNSTGAQSIVYGNTREHILGLKGYLADGSFVELTAETFAATSSDSAPNLPPSLQTLGKTLQTWLADESLREAIRTQFPHPSVKRRNTGYALDALLATEPLNLIPLIAGSEGTLMFITEATVKLTPLPPAPCGVIAAHFDSITDALHANLIILRYHPHACELIDHYILACTEKSIEQRKNRDFIKGQPQAILIVEIRRETHDDLQQTLTHLQTALLNEGRSTHAPILTGADLAKPWKIRHAGLGLLSNVVGDSKPIALVEDTAVRVADLPEFVKKFTDILATYDLSCVHYAHAGAGELHLRPIINIKTPLGKSTIRNLATKIAALVKDYRGSLSGEHGDGRLRGEFIEYMVGSELYQVFKNVKTLFDPENLFNPHKIVSAPKMNEMLRYEQKDYTPDYETYLDFSDYQGMVRLAEMCNGSGECRRSHLSTGLMCPSYMATRNERDTTRARANILREILKNPNIKHPFAQQEVISVLSLCLSCKGCKAQCPSSVDMAALKSEYLTHYHTYHRPSLRTWMFKSLPRLAAATQIVPGFIKNLGMTLSLPFLRTLLNLHPQRPLPRFSKHSGTTLIRRHTARSSRLPKAPRPTSHEKIFLFVDEYTNVFDSQAAEKTFLLLQHLGYDITVLPLTNSGRSFISEGFLKEASALARQNLKMLQTTLASHSSAYKIIGLEPSALLTFRDEFPALLRGDDQALAKELATHTFLLEEFLITELLANRISSDMFPHKHPKLAYFVHCHQQALASLENLPQLFNLISETPAQFLGEGCCGMAGTFGYEREHATISKDIANLRLLPNLNRQDPSTKIVATGFSCRDQITFLSTYKPAATSVAFYETLETA